VHREGIRQPFELGRAILLAADASARVLAQGGRQDDDVPAGQPEPA
jgi:hypothetical protein